MDTFRLRLKEYLDERGISVYALIQSSGLAPNTAYAIARGSSGNARLDTIAAIVTGLRRLTGEDVTLSDIVVHESTPDPTTSTSKMRATPEKPKSGPSPDDREWLEAFFAAAKGRSTEKDAPHYDEGSVVLVQFDRQQLRPCVTLTRAKAARESQVCGIVPLAAPSADRISSFDKTMGGLPASSTALCTQVQTVKFAQVVGFVGRVEGRYLKDIKDALTELFALERAADGRYYSRQRDQK